MVRLFIAIEIEDEDVLRRVIALRDEVLGCSKEREIKGVEDENIHLTLRFIGEVSESLVPAIINCLDRCSKYSQFTMELRGVGVFPSLSRPRVIWVGVKGGASELKTLRGVLDDCLRDIKRPEHQEFVPHITIARVKRRISGSCLRDFIMSHSDDLVGTSRVTKVVLKRSILKPQGPEYIDIHTVKLKGV
ncbi:MAG: RNA 2',3'-cyclic phosphodiesterase [Desulfurococcales archaeon ex4484_204]|nr:MAG: RNA 2',3'-cyclic phosphodiesterase [Desulfurococcales archaeon ex4484_204]